MKTCTKCKKELPKKRFYKYSQSKDGLDYVCIECSSAASRLNYRNSKEAQCKKKIWQEKNKERHNQHVRNYYQRKREKKQAELDAPMNELVEEAAKLKHPPVEKPKRPLLLKKREVN